MPKIFRLHEAFLNSDDDRVRGLVQNLKHYADGRIA